jgi:hypothetical protein
VAIDVLARSVGDDDVAEGIDGAGGQVAQVVSTIPALCGAPAGGMP